MEKPVWKCECYNGKVVKKKVGEIVWVHDCKQ